MDAITPIKAAVLVDPPTTSSALPSVKISKTSRPHVNQIEQLASIPVVRNEATHVITLMEEIQTKLINAVPSAAVITSDQVVIPTSRMIDLLITQSQTQMISHSFLLQNRSHSL